MASWIQGNFLYAIVAGVVMVIVGGLVAMKADNKFGYLVLAGGVGFILWTMKLHGLF